MSWAGQPSGITLTPQVNFVRTLGSPFCKGKALNHASQTEAWQKGRIERHSQIVKNMLHRYDQEKTIEDVQEFDTVLRACLPSKNALSRQDGFSPEQIVLGKSPKVTASLTSDEQVASHSLADGSDLDCEKFRRILRFALARKMFLLADNDAAIRRALLRKSCPPVDTYTIGQHVMYWKKKNTFGRREVGRWHGPARIVCRDGSTTMWIAHGDKLLRCAPENLRPASLREWSSASVS